MSLIEKYIPSVIFLQEIWLPYHEESLINRDFHKYTFKISSPDMFTPVEDKMMTPGPVWHGTAIGWHEQLNTYITHLEPNHERFVGLKISAENTKILLISLF